MRAIERSSAFKRDYRREARDRRGATLGPALTAVLTDLADDKPLAPRYHDHELSGDWSGYRECHVRSDLLLIYSTSAAGILRLARLGSHSELFG